MIVIAEQKALAKAKFDFLETLGHINLLNKFGLFGPVTDANLTLQWQALSIAALICYSRPFLKSYKLESLKGMLEANLSDESKKNSHQKFLNRRNQLIAHSDGDGFEIQVLKGNPNALSLHAPQKYLNREEAEDLRLLASDMLKTVI